MKREQDHSKYQNWIDPNEVRPYERNVKIHTDKQVANIARSIKKFGWQQDTVITRDKVLVIGHGRRLAALKLGCEMPYHVVDKDADELTDKDIRELRIADNLSNSETGYDFDLGAVEIADLEFDGFDFDLSEWGNSEDELKEVVEDEPPETVETRCKMGDIWQMGGVHRLMCGDSTDPAVIDRLMDGVKADICFTSPPYNMGASVGGGWGKAPKQAMHGGFAYDKYDDAKSRDDYRDFLCNALKIALLYADNALFNLGILAESKTAVIEMLNEYKDNFCDIIVWNKSASMPHGMESQKGMLSHRCEMVFAFNQNGSRAFTHPQWAIGTGINRIDTANASGNKYSGIHAATFPVEFAEEVVKNFTERSCLDIFGGTGTTLIACEQLNRKCYMCELDPHYCDVILQRWENLTGKKAELVI